VTPSPEPQSAPEADRSADFDSFLDDFDPSDGDNTARVEDASAWLDGSPGGPALSPDATNARPSAGNDSASSLEFATPEFAASASRGLEARGGALDGDASDGDATRTRATRTARIATPTFANAAAARAASASRSRTETFRTDTPICPRGMSPRTSTRTRTC
jgi:hypothetical protein